MSKTRPPAEPVAPGTSQMPAFDHQEYALRLREDFTFGPRNGPWFSPEARAALRVAQRVITWPVREPWVIPFVLMLPVPFLANEWWVTGGLLSVPIVIWSIKGLIELGKAATKAAGKAYQEELKRRD